MRYYLVFVIVGLIGLYSCDSSVEQSNEIETVDTVKVITIDSFLKKEKFNF